jgi:hypothetical protein
VGLDRDPVVTLFAGANLRNSAAGLYRESRAICGDAENVDLSAYSGWHIDPDRRPHGRRTTGVEQMLPSRESIERMLTRNPHAAVKLAPAASPPREWQEQAELEWISRDRECRQQVAWFGNVAQSPGVRRASLLDASGALIGQIVGTSISLPDPTARVEEYIFEPDPAVLAAGLAGQLAQALQVVPIAREIPYLTSAEPLAHPLLTAFRVLEVLPLDEKRLAAMLRARRIGRLEIKCRGVHLVPEEFRRRLRLGGDRSGVLLITPHGGRTVAILAQRLASRGGARRREG